MNIVTYDSTTQTTDFLIASVLTVPERKPLCESNFLFIGAENQPFLFQIEKSLILQMNGVLRKAQSLIVSSEEAQKGW